METASAWNDFTLAVAAPQLMTTVSEDCMLVAWDY